MCGIVVNNRTEPKKKINTVSLRAYCKLLYNFLTCQLFPHLFFLLNVFPSDFPSHSFLHFDWMPNPKVLYKYLYYYLTKHTKHLYLFFSPSQPREKGRMRFHKLQNVQIALDFLRHRQVGHIKRDLGPLKPLETCLNNGSVLSRETSLCSLTYITVVLFSQVKLVNIRNDDIADGNPKLTLGLIWTIILHFQVSSSVSVVFHCIIALYHCLWDLSAAVSPSPWNQSEWILLFIIPLKKTTISNQNRILLLHILGAFKAIITH